MVRLVENIANHIVKEKAYFPTTAGLPPLSGSTLTLFFFFLLLPCPRPWPGT